MDCIVLSLGLCLLFCFSFVVLLLGPSFYIDLSFGSTLAHHFSLSSTSILLLYGAYGFHDDNLSLAVLTAFVFALAIAGPGA